MGANKKYIYIYIKREKVKACTAFIIFQEAKIKNPKGQILFFKTKIKLLYKGPSQIMSILCQKKIKGSPYCKSQKLSKINIKKNQKTGDYTKVNFTN